MNLDLRTMVINNEDKNGKEDKTRIAKGSNIHTLKKIKEETR